MARAPRWLVWGLCGALVYLFFTAIFFSNEVSCYKNLKPSSGGFEGFGCGFKLQMPIAAAPVEMLIERFYPVLPYGLRTASVATFDVQSMYTGKDRHLRLSLLDVLSYTIAGFLVGVLFSLMRKTGIWIAIGFSVLMATLAIYDRLSALNFFD